MNRGRIGQGRLGRISKDAKNQATVERHLYIDTEWPTGAIDRAVRSASPNDNVIPDPPGAVTIRTPGAGSASRNGRSGCSAYTPCHRSAIRQQGNLRNVRASLRIKSSIEVWSNTLRSSPYSCESPSVIAPSAV